MSGTATSVILRLRLIPSQSYSTCNGSGAKAKLGKCPCSRMRVRPTAAAATVAATVMATMIMAGAAVIVERMRAMTALTAIIVACSRGYIHRHSAQGASAGILSNAAPPIRHIFTFLLATAADELSGPDTNESAFG